MKIAKIAAVVVALVCMLPTGQSLADRNDRGGAFMCAAPAFQLELKSSWGSNCRTGTVASGLSDRGGGWSPWSPGVITSDWDGSPWNCLQARIFSATGRTRIGVELDSSWGSSCTTGPVQSGLSRGSNGDWSAPLITSDWDGAPWSCLKARVVSNRRADFRCKIKMRSQFGSSCQTGATSTGPTLLRADGRLESEWSGSLITSDWDGAPWSCLNAKLICRPDYR